jgi:hypothetical protein
MAGGYTVVTCGPIADPNGTLYVNAKVEASLDQSAIIAGGGPPLLGGTSVFQTIVNGETDSFGNLVLTLADVNQITPPGCVWDFSVVASGGAIGFTLQNQVITGNTQNISAALHAVAAVIGNQLIPGVVSGNLSITGNATVGGTLAVTGAVTAQSLNGFASVKGYGALGDGVTDDTAAINSAFAAAHNVYFPDGTYMVNATAPGQTDPTGGGVIPQSNSNTVFSANAILKALPNSTGQYNVLRLHNLTNVRISGGIIDGNKANCTGAGGTQYGFGIMVAGCVNVWIDHLITQNCWGDGVYLRQNSALSTRSQNIYLNNVTSNLNRRQGMSLVDVNGIIVESSVFSNTSGSAPQAGIDIEPGGSGNAVNNVQIESCQFLSNTGRGFVLQANTGTDITDVFISNCLAKSNSAEGFVSVGVSSGSVAFSNCTADGNGSTAGFNITSQTASANIGITITGGQAINNSGVGYAVLGTSNKIRLVNTYAASNTLQGYNTGTNASGNPSKIDFIGNTAYLNGSHGFQIGNQTDGNFIGNIADSNSQTTNLASHNFLFSVNTSLLILGNTARAGALTNKPARGLLMNTNTACTVALNDLQNGGATSDLLQSSPTTEMLYFNRLTGATPLVNQTISPNVAGANDLGTSALPWGNLYLNALIPKYNSITTAGNGISSIYGATSQKAEAAADASVLTFTPPAIVGSYRLRFVLSISAAASAVVGWTATWTDSNGSARAPANLSLFLEGTAAPALTFTTSSVGNYYGDATIDINNSATAIVIKFTLASGTITAKASATIERLI